MRALFPDQLLAESVVYLTDPDEYQVVLRLEGQAVKVVIRHEVKTTETAQFFLNIVHQASHTHAQTIMKSVVQKKGRVVLQGKISIAKDVVGCTSFLTQRVLLLDPSAKAEAIPELEIHNNDVRCSHAASISGVDLQQLHYLMSRGMTAQKATSLLSTAFLSD